MNQIINQKKQNYSATIVLKALLLVMLFAGLTAKAQYNPTKIHVGLIYPISSNGKHAPLDTNNLSVHLLAGISSVENGVSFAGISNVVRNNSYGTQIAGFSNHIGNKATGVLLAGFTNTYKENNGAAFAGFANIAHGNIKAAQFAGFLNVAKKVNGTTFAGFMNVATDVSESQFAGFINVARKVKGAQIAGFINVADSSDCPIGILNFIKNGEKSIGVSIDENRTSMLQFRSGGKTMYGIIGLGYNFKNEDEVYAFEAGFGAHFFPSKAFRLNLELTQSFLESFEYGEYARTSFKVFPAVKITKHIELYAGPALHFTTTNTVEGQALSTKNIRTWQHNYSDFVQYLSIGYSGGINILF